MKSKFTLFCITFLSIHFLSAQSIVHHENLCSQTKSNTILRRASASVTATSLMQQYDMKFQFLDLEIQRDTNRIKGNVKTLAQVSVAALDTFVFELHSNYTIDSVCIGGNRLPFFRRTHDVYVPLASTALLGDMIDAKIYYKGNSPTGGFGAIGNGFTAGRSTRWGNLVTWSLSQPFVAYEWFPCKQDLMDKIDSTYFYITTDTPNMAGSNGLLKQVIDLPGGKRQFQWININPIDYYLISVACAKYIDYSVYAHPAGSADSVLMQNYIYDNPGTLPAFKGLIDTTALTLDYFSTIFGPYPFEKQKYGHCLAPFSGGMEHQTMTSQGFFEFTIDAHELGHQWFGDNVTCQTWRDIWVNEGFASYTEYLAIEHFYPADKAAFEAAVHDNVMSQPDGSVWFSDSTNVNRIFSGRLTYDKGGAIIHTLRFLFNNDALFFQGLKNYQNTFKNATATALDMKATMEAVSGLNLNDWMNQWFYGEGYPTFDVSFNQVANLLYINVKHSTSSLVTPLFKTPLELKCSSTSGDTTIRINVTSNDDNFIIQLDNKAVDSIVVDPNNWIINNGSSRKDETLAIGNDIQNQPINIYPSLVSDYLFISAPDSKGQEMKLFDMTGHLILQSKLQNTNNIDLQQLSAGSYNVIVRDAAGKLIFSQKIIKQ